MERDTLTHKRCSRCEEHKPTTAFYKDRRRNNGLQSHCIQCFALKDRKWRMRNPCKDIFRYKRNGARRKGIPFTINIEDITFPTHCPVLGIELNYDRARDVKGRCLPNSPSFDRIDPNKGYLPGNVIIVSHQANTIKSNATVDQLKKVAAYYEQLIPQEGVSHVPEAS